MSSTFPAQKSSSSIRIPRLQVQVNRFHSGSKIANLYHGHSSSDPTNDGFYDWNNPVLTLFTREMTPEVLALGPVIVLERYIPNARNSRKSVNRNRGSGRWVIPGNSKNNGLQYHGGDSSTNRIGATIPEVDNFMLLNNSFSLGYNHVGYDTFQLPVSRFVKDPWSGTYGQIINRAVFVPEWNDNIVYSQFGRKRNYTLKFRLSLAVPNPGWTQTNHQNKYIFGEGQTIIVEPRLQTFNDGNGPLEYYIGWRAKVVN